MEEACPGDGKCHGPLAWCDWCGNVAHMCDAEPGKCDCHRPCDFPFCGVLRCYEHEDYDPEETCKKVLES